jgi:hypothetical protein
VRPEQFRTVVRRRGYENGKGKESFGVPFSIGAEGGVTPQEATPPTGKDHPGPLHGARARVNLPEFGCGPFNLASSRTTVLAAAMEFPGLQALARCLKTISCRKTQVEAAEEDGHHRNRIPEGDLSRQAVRIFRKERIGEIKKSESGRL